MNFYEIVVRGHINERLTWWFEDAVVIQLPSGETSLVGPVADQAALYGILTRIRDLGLPLVFVRKAELGTFPRYLDKKVE